MAEENSELYLHQVWGMSVYLGGKSSSCHKGIPHRSRESLSQLADGLGTAGLFILAGQQVLCTVLIQQIFLVEVSMVSCN